MRSAPANLIAGGAAPARAPGKKSREKLGSYELIRRMAIGGMAEIYLAQPLDRTAAAQRGQPEVVVLKQIRADLADDAVFVQMFLDESRLAAKLHHKNIAKVYEIGETHPAGIEHNDGIPRYNQPFFAMEYLSGKDARALLNRAIERDERIPLAHALTIVCGAAAGLHYAHEKRDDDDRPLALVHGDVSLSNIIVTYAGVTKLVDFGLARVRGRSEVRPNVITGKLSYMSPEQCLGRDLDRRSDIFSLGVVLYELTTTSRLFRRFADEGHSDILERITRGDIKSPAAVVADYPPALEEIVMRALASNPDERYASAAALLDELLALSDRLKLDISEAGLAAYASGLFASERSAEEASRSRAADDAGGVDADSLSGSVTDRRLQLPLQALEDSLSLRQHPIRTVMLPPPPEWDDESLSIQVISTRRSLLPRWALVGLAVLAVLAAGLAVAFFS